MADTIRISLALADAAAQKSLSDFITKSGQADKSFKKLGETGKGTFGEISVGIGKSIGAYEIFQGNLAANIALKAFEVMKDAASDLFKVFVVEGVHAAQEAEDALNSLNVALGQSGHYSKQASRDFQEFAAQLQKTTTFEDDAIIKNAALIESMTRLDNDGLKRVTKAAVELSAAFGIDLETASRTLAKASEGNTTSLKKLGVSFEESGTKAGTFQNALRAIESQLGGSAASKINTYSGAVTQSKNAFNDLQESIGNLIIKNPAVVAAIGAVTSVIRGSSKAVEDGTSAYQILIAEGFVSLIKTTALVAQAFNIMGRGIQIVFKGISDNFESTLAVSTGGVSLLYTKAIQLYNEYKEKTKGSNENIEELKGPLSSVVTALDQIGIAAQGGLDKLKSGAASAVPDVVNVTGKVKELTEEQIRARKELDDYVLSLAKQNDSLKTSYDSQLQTIIAGEETKKSTISELSQTRFIDELALESDFFFQKATLLDQNRANEEAKVLESRVSAETKTKALLSIDQKHATDSLKLKGDHDKRTHDLQAKADALTVANRKDTLSTISTLSSSSNVTLAQIGKAAGVAQIAIDTPVAISKALASAPPPFNFALAGLVGVAMAAQAAQLAGVQFAEGGIVPGTSFSGDLVQARVNSGEMVLNAGQQKKLFDMANGRGNGNGDVSALSEQVRSLAAGLKALASQPLVVNVDGRELFNITRDQLNSGRSYS